MTGEGGPAFQQIKRKWAAEAAEREALEASLKVQHQEAVKTAEDWRTKWFLSLAVANGALAAGLASRLPEAVKEPHLWFVLLPALWLAVFGLLVAGGIPFCWTMRLACYRDYVWAKMERATKDHPDQAKFTLNGGKQQFYSFYIDQRWKWLGWWGKAAGVGEVVSSLGFIASAAWVLVTLTLGK